MTTPRRLRRPQAKRFTTYAQRLDAFLRAGHRAANQIRAFEAAWNR